MNQRTFIVVNDQFDGIHCWEYAPNFLQHPHHHRFQITLKIVAPSNGNMDRKLEFFAVRQILRKAVALTLPIKEEWVVDEFPNSLPIEFYNLSGRSVEQFSNELNLRLIELMGLEKDHPMIIQVMEDGYAGSESYYNC